MLSTLPWTSQGWVSSSPPSDECPRSLVHLWATPAPPSLGLRPGKCLLRGCVLNDAPWKRHLLFTAHSGGSWLSPKLKFAPH